MISQYLKQPNILGRILLSLSGIFALLMPWIVYPMLKLTLYGKDGDGWLISITFFLIFIILALGNKFLKKSISEFVISIFSFGIFALSTYKIYKFHNEMNNYATDSPIMGYAGSGGYLSYGLYFILIVAVLIFILSIFSSVLKKWKSILLLLGGSIIVAMMYWGVSNKVLNSSSINIEEQKQNIETDFNKMSSALKDKRSEDFISSIHPIVYQSIGGKAKLIALMNDIYANIKVQSAEIVNVEKIHQKGKNVQALISQKITLINNNEFQVNTSFMIGFSYDGGVRWVFAGTENKPFKEMKKTLPEIYEELKY